MKPKAISCAVSFLLIFCSLAFGQAQTGSIQGYVVDEKGEALPGVTVTISSPSLMGTQSFLSTEKGAFRFPFCPPGTYVVKAEVPGFRTVSKTGVVVRISTAIDIRLEITPTEQNVEVSVTAENPVVDTKSSKTTYTVDSSMIKNLPVNRDVLDIVKLAPGVVEEGGGTDYRKMVSIRGGTIQQTTYAMDGVSLSDPTRAYITMGVAFDAIDEMEVVTGGVSAEIGQMSGGYVNVVSKSGGNQFAGSATVQYNGEGFSQSTLPVEHQQAFGMSPAIFDKFYLEGSLTLGGPIIKDKLWFFLNPQYGKQTRTTPFIPFTDPTGFFHKSYDLKRKNLSLFGKISAQISSKLKFMGMYQNIDINEDPNWTQVTSRGAYATYEALPQLHDAGQTVSTVMTFIIDQNTFAEWRGGFVYRYMDTQPWSVSHNDFAPVIQDRATNQRWGNYGTAELHHRYKWNTGLNLTKFLDNVLGADHEVKIGAEYGYWYTEDDRGQSVNPHSVGYYNGTPWYYHNTQPYVGRIILSTVVPQEGMVSLNKATRISAFLQDNFSLGRLRLNLGLRYDKEWATRPEETRKGYADPNFNGLSNILLPNLFSTVDMIAPEIKNFMVLGMFQPRIGLSYDLFGNGKTGLKASFSRYYDPILAANFGNVHPFLQSVTFLWNDLDKDGVIDLPPTDTYSATSIPLLITDPTEMKNTVDPNLKAPYTDEFIVGIKQELAANLSISLEGVYKEGKNIIEQKDLNNPIDGDMWLPYTATEPGDDGKFGTGDDHQITVFGLKQTAASPYPFRTNIPFFTRKYWATELTLQKRMANNWQFSGSVIYSKQYGNIGFGYYDSQGVRGYYMNPNVIINKYGRQNWDRPLQIKLNATVILPYGINASAAYRYMSGAPLSEGGTSAGQTPYNRTVTIYFPSTINGFALKEPSVTVFAEPLGSKRNSPTSTLDLRLEKTFHLLKGTLGLVIDAYNVLGSYRLYMSQDPGGYVYANGTFSRWPTFGKVLSAEGARVIKLTLRFAFGR